MTQDIQDTQQQQTTHEHDALIQAKQELDKMTPESFLELTNYMKELERAVDFPEASGVAWGTLIAPSGMEVSVTGRGISVIETLDDFVEGVQYGVKALGMRPKATHNPVPIKPDEIAPRPSTPPAVPLPDPSENEPQYVDIVEGDMIPPVPATAPAQPPLADTDVFDVTHIAHVKTLSGGRSCLRVRGGNWSKYGVRAYEEVIPADLGYEEWDVDMDYLPPDHMKKAWLALKPDGKPLKIVKFAAQS